MELLFNKTDADFSREFKEALGYVDADFKFTKLAPDLRTATRSLAKEIGNDTYLEMVATYQSTFDYQSTEGQILQLAQNAIANHAYRLFAPANDLQHGVNGRKMLTSEDSKTPFEHMLVASDDEMERRSFRAMDDLINLLDESSSTWKSSDNYKASHKNFVRTVAEFDEFYTIESRYLLQKLAPGLSLAEKRVIIPRIGKAVFDDLKAKRKDDATLTPDEINLLLLINEACVYYSLSWGIPRLQATLFPTGLYQQIRSDRSAIKGRAVPLGNQVDQLSQLFKFDTERVLIEIEDFVKPEPIPGQPEPNSIPVEDEFGFSVDDGFAS